MRNVALQGDRVNGSVRHHAGHVIDHDSDGNPIYCKGHPVIGTPKASGEKLRVNGVPVIVEGDRGSSNCACDAGPVTMNQTNHLLRISGKDAVLDGDQGDFHGNGDGRISAPLSKLRVKR